MSDTTRRAILGALGRGKTGHTIETVVERTGLATGTVRRALRTLEVDGAVAATGVLERGTRGRPPVLYARS